MAGEKGAKRKKDRKKTGGGRGPKTPSSTGNFEEVEGWSTEEILHRLGEYGIVTDERRFCQDAQGHLGPVEISSIWLQEGGLGPGRRMEFLPSAAIELWRRFLPEREALDSLLAGLDRFIDRDDLSGSQRSGKDVQDLMRLLDRLDACLADWQQRNDVGSTDLMDIIFERHGYHLPYALACLPQDLAGDGFVDEAVAVAKRYAHLDPENMRGDLGLILADAGRCQEALEQAEENLRDFCDDPWVVIKAGYVFETCDNSERAIAVYLRALEIAEANYTQAGVYERLIPLCRSLGREEQAEELQRAWEELGRGHGRRGFGVTHATDEEMASVPRSAGKKVGRNEPCPCGSGKKYKKCCLNSPQSS
jgi:hypothetical protein